VSDRAAARAVLVTGGAGYVGSHVVLALRDAGEHVVVLDDLSTGFRESVGDATLVVGDVGDRALVTETLRAHKIDTVVHCAARTLVGESVAQPQRYYRANAGATLRLIESCIDAGVQQFVFSSTASVYGNAAGGRADEDTPAIPINPYGASKLAAEWMLRDVAATGALRHLTLRYFNVAGADPALRIGHRDPQSTLLFKVACAAVLGRRGPVAIHGTDYATPDGTGVRDYIHVADIANIHVQAVRYLRDGGTSQTLNCGYGHGHSVREVLAAVSRAAGREVPAIEAPRRAGDPAVVIAIAERVRSVLGWTPRHDDLDAIARSAFAWERGLVVP
jgi:UDP-glucose 4-epimerase